MYTMRHLTQELLNPNILIPLSSALFFAVALTSRERLSILERDDFKCQFPMYSERRGWHICGYGSKSNSTNLHCHHLETQRNGGNNDPRNLLILCKMHHTHVIHPDVWEATQAYRAGNKDAFKEMIEKREQIIADGEIYWNDSWDIALKERATYQTHQRYFDGWKMFKKRK